MNKRSLAAGLTLALTLSLTPVQAANTTYLDVGRGAWYATPIAFCQQHQLMDGASSSSFEPEAPLTRAALAESLYRLAGSPLEAAGAEDNQEEESPFTDVDVTHPSFAAIRWARNSGVVSGYPDGTFRPDASITREEIAVCDGIIMALPFLLDGGAAGTAAIVTDRLRDTRYLDYTMVKEV